MFETCPRSWYYKYILKIPVVEDLVYAHRGNVVHHCLEEYYPEKTKNVKEIKKMFEAEWNRYNLSESKLQGKKDETWLMILNGINLDLNVTSTELKIYYPDVVSYLDVVDSKNNEIYDWKSSTRSAENEHSYTFQLMYYAWLYHRKFNILPNKVGVYYLKYNGSKSKLFKIPTMEDVKKVEKWHYNIRTRMEYYMNNPEELPEFNTDYFFSPYKHLWNINHKNPEVLHNYVIELENSYLRIKGNIDEFLNKHITTKFSYEKKDKYFIKKHYPNANTTICFWNSQKQQLPIGFYNRILKTLHDYAQYRNKTAVIEINDKRNYDDTIIQTPEQLLSGLKLRPYQKNAIESYINNNGYGMLEIGTGGGKSLIAAEITRRLSVKTLFVVDKKELLYQMKETYEQNLGVSVGVIGDGKCDVKDVTVATIQTLMKNIKLYEEYLNKVRFCIIDECHKAAAKSYYKLGRKLNNCERILGITGTAYRDDGNDMMIHATAGDVVYRLDSKTLIQDGFLQRPEITFVSYDLPEHVKNELEEKASKGTINEEKDYIKYYEQFVKNDVVRNNVIHTITRKHYNDNVLIVVKLVEHGKYLESLIEGSKYIHGSTNKTDRDTILQEFKNGQQKTVISTISIFAEGVNIPSLDVVINASANAGFVKTIQLLGRVLRKNAGKNAAYYYDLDDTINFFKYASYKRMKAFRKEGHSIVKKHVTEL